MNDETARMNQALDINRIEIRKKLVDELNEKLDSKDYIITVYSKGDEIMSSGDRERQISPRRTYKKVSLNELSKIIDGMGSSYWNHPDLKSDKSNASDIPFEEKNWGVDYDIVVEPLSEELEQNYLSASEKDFFKIQRRMKD